MATDGEIGSNERGGVGRYSIVTSAGEAELVYSLDTDNRMIITHTYVPPAARGRAVALRLVERAVADAAERGLKIIPQCSYVARIAERRTEWAHLFA
jgi:hypothetical protein